MDNTIEIIAAVCREPDFDAIDILSLMYSLDVQERAFAVLMNVEPATVRLWTNGVTRPSRTAQRLMQIYRDVPASLIVWPTLRMKKIAEPSGREEMHTLERNERLRLILEILHHTREGADLRRQHDRLLMAAIKTPSAGLDAQVCLLHRRVLDGTYTKEDTA